MAPSRTVVSKEATQLAGDPAVRSHAHKRMDRMTLMGLIVPKLISVAKISQPWTFGIQGATLQAGRGRQVDETQAAHNLPRDLTLNGRPIWQYATKDLKANARLTMQFYYSAAATMTVQREANYIDSAWERSPMPERWMAYVKTCAECAGEPISKRGALPSGVLAAGIAFKQMCQATLSDTFNKIKAGDYYPKHKDLLDRYFAIYKSAVDGYYPVSRLDDLWRIYQRDSYR
jgi:hypothetical protein